MKLSELFENTGFDYEHNELIKKSIRKYANDPHKTIDSAIGLVYAVYHELGLDIPNNMKDDNYDEFNDLCIYAAKELNKSQRKGIRDDRWKINKDDSPWH